MNKMFLGNKFPSLRSNRPFAGLVVEIPQHPGASANILKPVLAVKCTFVFLTLSMTLYLYLREFKTLHKEKPFTS